VQYRSSSFDAAKYDAGPDTTFDADEWDTSPDTTIDGESCWEDALDDTVTEAGSVCRLKEGGVNCTNEALNEPKVCPWWIETEASC